MFRRLKSLLPKTRLALCGDHVTALPEETLAACPVYALVGGRTPPGLLPAESSPG